MYSYLKDMGSTNNYKLLFDNTNRYDDIWVKYNVKMKLEAEFDNHLWTDRNINRILNLKTNYCHICAIEVPKSYIKEHLVGEKHITCLKITDLAIERSRNYMKSSFNFQNHDVVISDTYFCDPCCVIVKIDEKNIHEESLDHKKSIKHVSILKTMAETFESIDNVEVETVNINKSDTGDINIDKYDSQDDTIDSHDEDSNDEDSNDEDSDDVTENVINDTEAYIEYAKDNSAKPNLNVRALDEMNLRIVAKNDDDVNVQLKNFHGYSKFGQQYYCRVCRDGDFQTKEVHQMTMTHIQKIMVEVQDRHCLRKIDDIWHHCIICNEIIKNTVVHIKTQTHINLLKNCYIDKSKLLEKSTKLNRASQSDSDVYNSIDVDSQITSQNDTVHYKICNVCKIRVIASEYKMHTRTSRHKSFATIKNTINSLSKSNNVGTVSKLNLICNLCKVTIAKELHILQEHINSSLHTENMAAYIIENNYEIKSKNRFYCGICAKTVKRKQMFNHALQPSHITNLAANTSSDNVENKYIIPQPNYITNLAANRPTDNVENKYIIPQPNYITNLAANRPTDNVENKYIIPQPNYITNLAANRPTDNVENKYIIPQLRKTNNDINPGVAINQPYIKFVNPTLDISNAAVSQPTFGMVYQAFGANYPIGASHPGVEANYPIIGGSHPGVEVNYPIGASDPGVKANYPMVGGSHPGVEANYPMVGGSHPGAEANYPMVGGSHPGVEANYPMVGGSHPGVGANYPIGASHPGVGANYPNGASHPGVEANYPMVGGSHPGVEANYPMVGGSHPGVGANYPIGASHPGVGANYPNGASHPGVEANYPMVGGSHPGVKANYPMVGGSHPGVEANYPIIGGSHPDVGENYPIIGGNHPDVGANYPIIGGSHPSDPDIDPGLGLNRPDVIVSQPGPSVSHSNVGQTLDANQPIFDIHHPSFDLPSTSKVITPIYYCSICKINVANFEVHKLTKRHKNCSIENSRKTKLMKKFMKDIIERNVNGLLNCKVCGAIDLENDYDELKNHCELHDAKLDLSRRNSNTLFPIFSNTPIRDSPTLSSSHSSFHDSDGSSINDLEIPIPRKIQYQFNETENDLLHCKICSVDVAFNSDAKTHINDESHAKYYDSVMKANKISRNDDKKMYLCEVCLVDVKYFDEITHILSRKHLDNVVKNPKIDPNCDGDVLTFEFAMSIKTRPKRTRRNRKQKIVSGSESPVIQTIENVSLTSDVDNATLTSDVDIARLTSDVKNDSLTSDVDNATLTSDVKNDSLTSDVEIATLTSDVKNVSLTSDVDNATLTSDVKNVSLTSDVENARLTSDVDNARLTSDVDNATLTSDVKNVSLTSDVENASSTSDVENARLTSDVENASSTSNAKNVSLPINVYYQFKKVADNDWVCYFCEIKVEKEKMKAHIENNSRHAFFFDNSMHFNGIIKSGEFYYCVICKRSMSWFNEIPHVFGKSHQSKKEGVPIEEISKLKDSLTHKHVMSLKNGRRHVIVGTLF